MEVGGQKDRKGKGRGKKIKQVGENKKGDKK